MSITPSRNAHSDFGETRRKDVVSKSCLRHQEVVGEGGRIRTGVGHSSDILASTPKHNPCISESTAD